MADETKSPEGGVFGDVQKGLAWFIVLAFVALIFVWVFKPPVMAPESMAQLNQLVSTLQNILLLAVGFFFGSSKLAQNKDEAQNKAAETLAAKLPTPPTGNGALEGDAMKAAVAAAAMAAPAAAAVAAPAAAAIAAPPAADIAAPPVVEAEVAEVVPREVEKQVAAAVAASKEVEKQK